MLHCCTLHFMCLEELGNWGLAACVNRLKLSLRRLWISHCGDALHANHAMKTSTTRMGEAGFLVPSSLFLQEASVLETVVREASARDVKSAAAPSWQVAHGLPT